MKNSCSPEGNELFMKMSNPLNDNEPCVMFMRRNCVLYVLLNDI